MSRWRDWHRGYDDADSPLARRLGIVQRCIADALDAAPPGPVRVISMCAGEGRDILGVVADHPRGQDVTGRLVELDPELARRARAAAPARIEVRGGDASSTSAYEGAVPADLVLVCGVFGNIPTDDITRTIRTLPSLCAPGAIVVWTRHRRPPDLTGVAREAFASAGFEEVAFETQDGFLFGIGVNRLVAEPTAFEPGAEMFTFVGFDALDGRCAECGFVYDLDRDQIVRRMRADSARFAERMRELDDAAARQRPAADVWSPLEYACHVRDMVRVQNERIELIQREDEPFLTPMGRDERVVEDRYNEQDPTIVTRELTDASRAFAERLAALGPDGWERTGMYTYPDTRLRTVEWIGNHTVHELQHHHFDITAPRQPA
jgi:DinB superfamily